MVYSVYLSYRLCSKYVRMHVLSIVASIFKSRCSIYAGEALNRPADLKPKILLFIISTDTSALVQPASFENRQFRGSF